MDANVTMTYDSRGNRLTMADGSGTTSFTYDEMSRTKTVETPAGLVVSYGYDPASQREHMVEPDGGRFTYTYTKSGQTRTLDNPQDERTTYTYDAAGRETLKELPNGTYASMSYDDADRLKVIENVKSTGAIVSKFTYTYDDVGNRTNVVEAAGDRVTWTHDATYQLTRERRSGADSYDTTYTYDPVGNRLVKESDGQLTTYTYDDANQLDSAQDVAGITTYTYDSGGNQILVEAPTGGLTTSSWDDENSRTKVELPSGEVVTSSYNGDRLRVRVVDSSQTKKFIWDEQNYLVETDDADATQLLYTNTPDGFGRLVSQRRKDGVDWTTDYFHFDGLGSTNNITDENETVQETYLYEAFGSLLSSNSYTPAFLYVGELGYFYDSVLLNYYIRERDYDPAIARWLSLDPVSSLELIDVAAAGIGGYGYVGNSPVDAVDPSGMWKKLDEWGDRSNIWEAEEGDTFEVLVQNASGDMTNLRPIYRNTVCIRPYTDTTKAIVAGMKKAWNKRPPRRNVAPLPFTCGLYDTSSLTDSLPIGEAVVSGVGLDSKINGYIDLATHFYRGNYGKTKDRLVGYIKEASKTGKTPIQSLTIIGHSWKSKKKIGGGGQNFSTADLRNIGDNPRWPKWDDAVKGKNLPPICWFRTDAQVRLVGCRTYAFARTFAELVLRGDAVAFGTTLPTWAVGFGRMGWGKRSGDHTFWEWDEGKTATSPTAYHAMAYWAAFGPRGVK